MRECKVTGKPLPTNLYNDNRGRPGIYRYRKPDGSYLRIENDYDEAVRLALLANESRHLVPSSERSLSTWFARYRDWVAENDPRRAAQVAWPDKLGYMRKFAGEFLTLPTHLITAEQLSGWWDGLTYDQQKARRAAFERWFNFMARHGAVKENPFSRSTLAHLEVKSPPVKKRMPLTMAQFLSIREVAPDNLRDAMDISFLTTMRIGDVVDLRFDMIEDGVLRKTILKSKNQRGHQGASHLAWDLSRHPDLREIINRNRELALKRKGCPYIVTSRPRSDRKAPRGHLYQADKKALSRAFARARDGLDISAPEGRTPPSFHEIRGLAIQQFKASGSPWSSISELAAHTDERVTRGYVADHVDWIDVTLVGSLNA